MTLTLRAVSLNDLPLTQPITAQFGPQGGTIGRADANTMALPDPERHISRQQAEIRGAPGGGYLIFNIGSANPITVGGQSLAQGQSLPLRDRAEIRIGGYLLEVTENAADDTSLMLATRAGEGAAPFGPASGGAASGPAGHGGTAAPVGSGTQGGFGTSPGAAPSPAPARDPFADLLGPGGSSSNPFADLLGAPPPPAPRSAFGETHRAAPVAAPAPAPSIGLLPDDFDPFAAPATPPLSSPPPASGARSGPEAFGGLGGAAAGPGNRRSAQSLDDPFAGLGVAPPASGSARPGQDFSGGGAFADLIPSSGAGASSLDDLFGLKPGASDAGDPLAGFMAEATRGAARDADDQFMSTDPMDLFGDKPSRPQHSEPVTPAQPDHTPALQASFQPPEVRRPRPASEPPVMPGQPPQPVQATGPVPPVPPVPPTAGGTAMPPPGGLPSHSATALVMDSEMGATVSAPGSSQRLPDAFGLEAPALNANHTSHASHSGAPWGPGTSPGSPADSLPAAGSGQGASAMPATSRPGARPTPGAAAAMAPGDAGGADAAALWQAFSEGAGIRFEPPQGLNPDLMRVMGQLLRSSVEGALQMMAVRAATKHELRAQVTVIRSRDNNPLKFSPDAQSALEQLLQPPVRGFLPGPAAMSDAMHDLVGHTIGTMAGTRAALEGVLGRFKPEMLESKLTSRSMLDSVLTLNRKAKLWELYLQHFESIRDEAQEDFHTLFGKAFLEAYEEQLERLNQRKSAA